ncbi:MAG: hypothetical protein P8X95_20005 [Anaerolineales bacterium]|jgi:hypothetical protein
MNWPRTTEVYIDSLIDYVQMIAQARETLGDTGSENLVLEAELATIRRAIDAMALRVIKALNAVAEMESPYPPALRELVYEAVRYATEAGQASYALDWTILVYW